MFGRGEEGGEGVVRVVRVGEKGVREGLGSGEGVVD